MRTFENLYLELAKLAKASGNEQLFLIAVRNRLRQSEKEMKRHSLTTNQQSA